MPDNPLKPKNGSSKTALLIIDMISDFEFEDGDALHKNAFAAARNIARLKRKANDAGIPVIYVNDNYGKWRDDFEKQVENIEEKSGKGRAVIKLLRPDVEDYYVLKAQRSAFFETPLALLLSSQNIDRLLITGVTTDICVLFTADDAYMRGFEIAVPSDCSAAIKTTHHEDALKLLRRVAHADTRPSSEVEFK